MRSTRDASRGLRRRVASWRRGNPALAGEESTGASEPSRFSLRDGPGGLLVPRPVFLFSSVRAGSTLLQMILDSHSRVHAPHELHLSSLAVTAGTRNSRKSLNAMSLDETTLANLLWDRLLHVQLVESGKDVVVDKTPRNTLQWRRVTAFWPQAHPLVLLRHPARVTESLVAALPNTPIADHYQRANEYANALADLREATPRALTVRYEDLTVDPEAEVRRICDWLGIDFEPAMLDYRDRDHAAQFTRGLGDWSDTLRSGVIRRPHPAPRPDEVPAELRDAADRLGY